MSRISDVLGELTKLGAVAPVIPSKPVAAPPPPAPVETKPPPTPEPVAVELPPVETSDAEEAIAALTEGFKVEEPAEPEPVAEAAPEPEPEEKEAPEPEVDVKVVLRQMRRSVSSLEAEVEELKAQLLVLEASL